MAVAFLALLALACTGKQQAGAATGTPTVQVQVGDATQINEVDYVAPNASDLTGCPRRGSSRRAKRGWARRCGACRPSGSWGSLALPCATPRMARPAGWFGSRRQCLRSA
ncbi:MAG: hypothetical protein U0531_14710 [Dehalococcoidia bacterium]